MGKKEGDNKRARLEYLKEYRSGEEGKLQRQCWLENNFNYYPNWRDQNREKYNQQQRGWLMCNREKRNEYMRNYMRKYRADAPTQPDNNPDGQP